MIDGFRPRRRPTTHPIVRRHAAQIVVGGHGHAEAQEQDREATFKTPDQAASDDALSGADTTPETSTAAPNTGLTPDRPPKHHRSFKEWLKARTKKQWIIFAIIAVLVLGSGITGALVWRSHHKPKPAAATQKVKPPTPAPAQPTVVPSRLTGLMVDPSVNQKPVTGIMIENSIFARPQSGLDHAGVVFEAVAEGGITRFLTLWQDTSASYIGPVRSVRPYYIQWAMGFDAAIAHVGGSPEALLDMKTWGVKDLDQFANGSYYHRISSRYAPHNVYTSMDEMNALEAAKGYGAAQFNGFIRKFGDKPNPAPTAGNIDLTISSADYNVHYDYDQAANAYKRSEGGAPHMELDQNGTQTQIEPKVVIALVMAQGIEADDLHTSYNTIGNGQAFIFQDGNVTTGTWNKPNNNAQFNLTDASGKPIALNAGQTWITVVNAANHIAYK